MSLQIHAFECGPVATIGYFVHDDAEGGALIVDAPFGSADLLAAAADRAGATPSALVLTHSHWDHMGDAAELKRRFPTLLVCAHRDDRHRLVEPMRHTVWPLPFEVEAVETDRLLSDGELLEVGGLEFRVIHTPGHTEGGICLYNEEHGVLFTGDTLFAESVGRTDLPGGDWESLRASIATKLFSLPDDTRVYPGHGASTTIGAEKEGNPYVGDGA